MAIFPSERSVTVVPDDATPEETAAILAALSLFLAGEQAVELPSSPPDLWSRAGRLEAMGIPVTPSALRRGWRA